MRLYSKKVPAVEASRQFISRVERQIHPRNRRERLSEDIEKSRFSHQSWTKASLTTKAQLERHLKEPERLLFFKGAIYEITFNKENEFSHSQLALLYDIPSEDDLRQWKKYQF